MEIKRQTHLAITALILANVIWGLTPVVNKWTLENLTPFTFAFLRFLVASLILLPFVYNRLSLTKKDFIYISLLAILGFIIHIGFYLKGLTHSSALNLSVYIAITPIFIVMGGIYYLKEKLSLRIILGSVMSLIGVLIIIYSTIKVEGLVATLEGNLYFIIGTLSFVVYTLHLKKIEARFNILPLTFWLFFLATVYYIPFALFENKDLSIIHTINYQGVLGVLFAALLASVIAFLLYMYSLKYLDVSATGVYLYITPIISIISAVVFLNEQLTKEYLIGTFIVFLSIGVSQVHLHIHKHRSRIRHN